MATAAEPRPASLPLPGGRPDASVRLEPLLTGTIVGPAGWMLREPGRPAWRRALRAGVPRGRRIPIPAFLVHHPGAGVLLVDTGLHPSVAVNPRASMGRLASTAFKELEMTPEQAVTAQLRARDIRPGDVKTVVMTHLHADHASAMSEFPDAGFLFSSAEWIAATERGHSHGYVKRQFDHAFDYRMLDFDGPDTGSFAGFGRSFDLFGDGSVRVAFTPGHSLGHMSVILRLRQREVLLAGDALVPEGDVGEQPLPFRVEDEHLYRRSQREIELYRRETPDALVIPSHDMTRWETLERVYE